MDIKALVIGGAALWMAVPALGTDIYKCEVDGVIKYQEEKCDENSVPVHLKELAAPLDTFDAESMKAQDARSQQSAIKTRIARHQKRIRHYRKKMEGEVDALTKPAAKQSKKSTARNSVKDQEQSSSLNNIASRVDKDPTSDLVNAIVNRYKALIEAEQFQIQLLERELKMYQDLSSDDKK